MSHLGWNATAKWWKLKGNICEVLLELSWAWSRQTGPKKTTFQLELESNRHYHPTADLGTEQCSNEIGICQCMNGAGLGLPFEVNLVICADVISPW